MNIQIFGTKKGILENQNVRKTLRGEGKNEIYDSIRYTRFGILL